MRHRKARGKLNLQSSHRTALLRNQVLHLIEYGVLNTTKPQARSVQQFAEKIVTIARKGNEFNVRRRVKQLLPYKDDVLVKLFTQIAPKYVDRPGGYTRIISLGRRRSDTAPVVRLMWVETEKPAVMQEQSSTKKKS